MGIVTEIRSADMFMVYKQRAIEKRADPHAIARVLYHTVHTDSNLSR